jgi:hypothetical protein
MNESPFSSSFLDLNQVFSLLTPQDVEQFQLLYQHWTLQQQIAAIERQIADVQRQLAENAEHIERVHPSAIALATLARLQASGVEDIDLLDRMLERGEAWLDRTIQQLEYCEQLDVIRGDYEEWCRHALEDAFAWIDSLQSAASANPDTAEPAPVPSDASSETAGETTEELFLQKLMSEEADESGQREAASAVSQSNEDDESEKSGNDEGNEKNEDSEDSEDSKDGIYNIDATGRNSEDSDENKDSAVSEEEKPATGHEEQAHPQIQEETVQRRSSFVQRFLSALWP